MNTFKNTSPQIIAFEGPDGCGKSTLIHAVSDRMDKEGIEHRVVLMIPEGPYRDALLNGLIPVTPIERLLLLGLAQIEAARQCEQALKEGKWVLLDRCSVSRRVHQELTEKLTVSSRALDSMLPEFPHITHLAYLLITFEEAEARLADRPSLDNIESLGADYREVVHGNYGVAFAEFRSVQMQRLFSNAPYTEVHELDATSEPEFNASMLLYAISDYLKEGNPNE